MTDGRFNSFGPPSSDDQFAYFPGASPSTTSTPFGGNPGGFGQPPGPATGFGGAISGRPATRPSRRRPSVAGPIFVVILLLLLAGGCWWWIHREPALALPDTVGGMPTATEQNLVAFLGKVNAAAVPDPSYEAKVGAYGSLLPGPGVIVTVIRGKGKPLEVPAEPQGAVHVGPITCVVTSGSMLCGREEGERAVAVLGLAGPGNPTLQPETVAAWVQEVWNGE